MKLFSEVQMAAACQIFRRSQRSLSPALLLWFLLSGSQLFAHSMSVSFVEVTLEGSRANLKYRLPMAELDLLFLIDENLDGVYQPEEVEKAGPQIDSYLQEKVNLAVNNLPVTSEPQERALWADEENHMFVDLWQEVVLSEEIRQIDFSVTIFQELIPDHKTLVLIDSEEGSRQFVFDQSNPGASWT
ncbi:MAG: DUF6702 family protein, partial [Acidobacteriota bacterium]